MIALNPAVWMIAYKDGQRVPFDPLRLKTELAEAFFLSGFGHQASIADEVVASIEFAMSQLSPEDRAEISEERLHELIAGVFAQTGYPTVAQTYIQLQTHTNPNPPGSLAHIQKLLHHHFTGFLTEHLNALADKIFQVVQTIRIVCPTDELIIELARNLHRQTQNETPTVVELPQLNTQKEVISIETLLRTFDEPLLSWVSSGVMNFTEITKLFPVLRLRIDWIKLVQKFDLETPLMESSLIAHFESIGALITHAHILASKLLTQESEFPISIEMTSSERFSVEILGINWDPENHPLAQQLAQTLAEYIEPHPYKIVTLRDQ